MLTLRSEQISRRLLISMLIIIFSILFISIPLIVSSYIDYQKSKQTLFEIQSLSAVADLTNKISRERGPANLAMSSSSEELEENFNGLQQYRAEVDRQIEFTFEILKKSGFNELAIDLKNTVNKHLNIGRQEVDRYIQTPFEERTSAQFDHAIISMFNVWDYSYSLLKSVMMQSKSKESSISSYYTLILILADLRDQAGRVASNVIAYVSMNQPLPSDNIARSLQTQKQVVYLWHLTNAIQPEQEKTVEFVDLYLKVKTEFIDRGMPMVMRLIDESQHSQPYFLRGTDLTKEISDKFLTVIDLQKYILKQSIDFAKTQEREAQLQFIFVSSISILSLFAALFTMIYARKKVFLPLIQARNMILDLTNSYEHGNENQQETLTNRYSLYDALQKLRHMMDQRDALEFRLKNIANTDRLTGVLNRLALDEYLKRLELEPERFYQLSLIMVDIDNFKAVNDHHGHIWGDTVIVRVAECLKSCVNVSDMIVRFGGDEFLVLIDQMEYEQVLGVAEKIRMEVANLKSMAADSLQDFNVSVSIGVAVGASDWNDLFSQADESLFKAKAKGKNIVAG
nr:GGDEF domain-containing protein [Acinetobacter sp. Marseille-Q1620]